MRNDRIGVLVPAALALMFAAEVRAADPEPAPSTRTFQVITPKDDRINAVDINARGEIVGTEWVEDKKDSNIVMESPFFARGKELMILPLLEGYTSTFPAAVSEGGVVVGRASKPGSFTRRVMLRNQAFIWDAKSGIRGLGALDGDVASIACGISRDGATISGYSVGDNRMRACVWDRVGEGWVGTPLPQKDRLGSNVVAISDDGRHVTASDGGTPCLWSRDSAGKWTREAIGEPGALIPRAVNDAGAVVGYTTGPDSRKHAVVRSPGGGCKRIEEPAGFIQSEANDVNNDGVVVGTVEKDMGMQKEPEPHAFACVKGRLRLIDDAGPNFIVANSINDRWQITGTFERDEVEEEAKK